MKGYIHLYCGDGKGKTTAAAGLALRAAGAGKKVVFFQFLKDGTSSEIILLKTLPKTEVVILPGYSGFLKDRNETELQKIKSDYTDLFHQTIKKTGETIDLLVLDEVVAACRYGVISEADLSAFLKAKPNRMEVILTGRNPTENLISLADYVTEMKKIKHPFDRGISARIGIEL